jgi:hypothetical protein
LLHDAGNKRHERFSVAALHCDGFAGDDTAAIKVEDGGGTGIERGIDGKNAHCFP